MYVPLAERHLETDAERHLETACVAELEKACLGFEKRVLSGRIFMSPFRQKGRTWLRSEGTLRPTEGRCFASAQGTSLVCLVYQGRRYLVTP